MKNAQDLNPEDLKLWQKITKSIRPNKGALRLKRNDPKLDNTNFSQIFEKSEIIPTPVKINNVQKTQKIDKTQTTKPKVKQLADSSNNKKNRRGNINIDATIDLHGLNQEQARSSLYRFILTAKERNYKTILIITGKGIRHFHDNQNPYYNIPYFNSDKTQEKNREKTSGILRYRLKEWLNDNYIRQYISSISVANAKHGGTGAFYLFLKTKP